MIKVPTEGDFLGAPDRKPERDFVEEALADGLIKDGDTRSTFERTYVPVAQRPDRSRAWTDDAIETVRIMYFTAEIDSWEYANEARLNDLYKYFPDEYQRISEALWDARENVSNLRW